MTQPFKLTKTQTDFLSLLAKGEVLVGHAIGDRTFAYQTIALLRRRRLLEHQDPNHESFYSPERLVITDRGRDVLSGVTKSTFELSRRQREILICISQGNPIVWQHHQSGIYAYFQQDVMIQPSTISALQKHALLKKLMPDRPNTILGNGYTLTDSALAAIAPHVSQHLVQGGRLRRRLTQALGLT